MKKIVYLLIIAGVLFSVWMKQSLKPVDTSNTKSEAVKIEQGMSLSVIANLLSSRDLIRSPFAFKTYARLTGKAGKLQAGAFAISQSQSVSDIIDVIVSGKTEEFYVTIPEGYTVADIDALLASKGLGQPGDIIDCAFRCDFSTFDFLPATHGSTKEEGIGSRLEGYLFPDTYSVSPADYVPKFFLERMLGNFRQKIVNAYTDDIKTSGRTLKEIVIMSSLVEEESRKDDERATVAGILWKRLDNSVVLGVDATTRYYLKKPTQILTKNDVEAESKYNTRRSGGLPPSAIANAGESAFAATLNPKSSQYWYYLHAPNGTIHYAVTNEEHNQNRARYLVN